MEIRFAVGERGDQLSPVWKIWSNKNDVYLTARTLGGFFKISLHWPDYWAAATTKESGAEILPGNRQQKVWKRPPEFEPGRTHGPHIAVARLAQHDHAKFDEKPTKSNTIEWIPKPNSNCKATVAVFFGSPDKTLDDFTGILAPGEVYVNDHLELENGEKVFIMVVYEPLTNHDAPTVGYLQSKADELTAVNDDFAGCLAIFMQAPPVPWVYVLKFATPPESRISPGPWHDPRAADNTERNSPAGHEPSMRSDPS